MKLFTVFSPLNGYTLTESFLCLKLIPYVLRHSLSFSPMLSISLKMDRERFIEVQGGMVEGHTSSTIAKTEEGGFRVPLPWEVIWLYSLNFCLQFAWICVAEPYIQIWLLLLQLQ